MLSCFGLCRDDADEQEREPLLPRYNDNTSRQARLHEKLHTYQMIRALSQGYMPSNEQAIVQLRCLLSSALFNPRTPDLSDDGRAFVLSVREWLQQMITVLEDKNKGDQIQDFLWYLKSARLHVDEVDIKAKSAAAKAKADTTATLQSVRTIGSLLLNNSQFRVFLSEFGNVVKEIFSETAFTLADVSAEAGRRLEASEDQDGYYTPNQESGESQKDAPSSQDLKEDVTQVADVVTDGARTITSEAKRSAVDHVTGEEKQELLTRLKKVVQQLRQKPDYSSSVSTLSLLLRRYLRTYLRAASETVGVVEDNVDTNRDADLAIRNFWAFVTSFGDRHIWDRVEDDFTKIVDAGKTDPKFEETAERLSEFVERMLTDPGFIEHADDRLREARDKVKGVLAESSIKDHVDDLTGHISQALFSIADDKDIKGLVTKSQNVTKNLPLIGRYTNDQIMEDSINVFLPKAVSALEFVPIPRLETSNPAIDLLLESLILEPGKTVNHTSFLPYKLHLTTQSDVEIRKARFKTTSLMTNCVTIKISGLSIAAEDMGYWLRLHSGLLRMTDEGIASFHLDERGIDISVDVEIGRGNMDEIISVRKGKVTIHKLNYSLSKSKFSFLAWIFKPLIRPILRKTIELQISSAIEDGLRSFNRELVYARERLRATRIANPDDLFTFIRAVAARFVPEADPDVETRLGVTAAGQGVFKGRYTPASLVKVWEEEGKRAGRKVEEYDRGGWRNDTFDVKVRPMG